MIATALPQRHVEHCMGTVFSIDVRAPGVAREAIDDVLCWLRHVDQTFSTYRGDSVVNRIVNGALAIRDCSREVRAVLQRCAELKDDTDGYFDVHATGRLDPSGYVKGWAIERASDLLVAAGSRNHCINGGGDVQCVGQAADDRDWGIGIADPTTPGKLIASVSGRHIAVATSGSAERGAHIVDPHTATPPTSTARSITVYGTHLADVDAYATAAFAMGVGAEAWLRRKGLRAVLVFSDGRLRST